MWALLVFILQRLRKEKAAAWTTVGHGHKGGYLAAGMMKFCEEAGAGKSNFNDGVWNFPATAYRNMMGIVFDWRASHAA